MFAMRPVRIILVSIIIGWLVAYYYISFYRQSHSDIMLKHQKTQRINQIDQDIKLIPVNRIQQTREMLKTTACDLLKSRKPLDMKNVINPDPYVNIIIPKTACDKAVYLVVYVHSSPHLSHRRDTIRRTWGNVSQYDVPVRLVFIVGLTAGDVGVQRSPNNSLTAEILNYGDIVQSNFMDTYRNLSRKAVAGLKWVTQHCRTAKYVLKTDDDTFVNMFLLLRLLRTKTIHSQYEKNVLICNLYNTSFNPNMVNRNGKWGTTKEECSMRTFPSFCQGIAFVMTMNVALTLYIATNYVPLLWMDDVYMTGFLPALVPKNTVMHLDEETFYMSTWNINKTTSHKVLSGNDAFKFIYYHEDVMEVIEAAWNRLQCVVLTQEFRDYADALLSNNMHLERKRLKDIPCTPRRRARNLC